MATVVVVEDERIVALNLRMQLGRMGYDVVGAAVSGAEAGEMIARLRPDVVLMDIRIDGDHDGIHVVESLPPDIDCAVIYLTAHVEEATLLRAAATRPYGYLLKPYSERELHATIQTALERRRADTALQRSEHQLLCLVKERTAALEIEIAERLKVERALYEAQKMEAIGKLTGGVAHDFNNLLTVIIMSLELAARHAANHRAQTLVRTALKAADRGQLMVAQLLAFSRQQVLRPEVTHISPLIRLFADLVHQACGNAVELVLDLDPGLAPAQIDQAQLRAAILNLAANARDAMPHGGTVTIRTANAVVEAAQDVTGLEIPPGAYVAVSVGDDGEGMAPDVVRRVIDPFFTTKDVGSGSGLGLSQVFGFTRQSGGYLTIASEAGRGTEVTLLLPGVTHDATLAREAPPCRGAVLVVDDEPLLREAAAAALTDHGYEVFTAANGPEALDLLRSGVAVDVMLTDIVMPHHVSGEDLAHAARMLRPEMQVVLTSASPRNRQGSGQEYRFLAKPFPPSVLLAETGLAMDRARSARDAAIAPMLRSPPTLTHAGG